MDTNPVVCIVDDDEAVRCATASVVRAVGWPTRVFASAEDFLQAADALGRLACLICDVQMTGMSGVEMHERLLSRGCAPPIILVTAFPTPELEARARANGAYAFLEKPVDATTITGWLARVCGKA
ncbi:response regulator transcription factor [Paraburkholderia phytofirmans]|uniref:Response regulator receiver protein n=2 Tax=Paraburkholderia phytofirmans TaxID=261302 RepID=B2T5E1_PARPJ|nr:response regulator [Paraburkholderia phytofirmans]ACD16802.1 response regulator receiver protein [Paraburkholderia phytofirmans PsJN]